MRLPATFEREPTEPSDELTETSTEQTSTEQTSTEQTSTEQTSTEQTSTEQTSTDLVSWKLLSYCYSVRGVANASHTGPLIPSAGLPADWRARQWGVTVLFDLDKDPGEQVDVSAKHPTVVQHLLERLAVLADASVQPMQWVKPYQGDNYECADCPLRAATGPGEAWTPWIA